MAHHLQKQTQEQASSSESQVRALRAELDAANKKVDGYVHLIASLSEELDNLRRSICHNCKKKFTPSYAVASPSDVARPLLGRRIVSRRQTSSGPPPVLPTKESPRTSIPISSITVQDNLTNSAPSATSPSSVIPKRPSSTPVQSKRPSCWSVSHNPEIKQALHIDLVKTFNFPAMVFCVKFSPDGKYLAVGLGTGSGKTYLYDVEKGSKICCLVDLYLKSQPMVWCVQFSPDNKYIATASGKQIRLWEIARKRQRAAFTSNNTNALSLCLSPNGRFLVTCETGSVRLWCLRDGSLKVLLDSNQSLSAFSITFSPDGRHIASVDFDCYLRIWNTRTGQLLDSWKGHTQDGLCVAFSSDGKGLVSGGGDRILRYWDVSSLVDGRGRGTRGWKFPQIRTFEGHTSCIRSVSFSPDSRWIATSSRDQSVRIWDPHTEEWQCTLHGHDANARSVDFSPVGEYLASGGEDRQVRLWKYREV